MLICDSPFLVKIGLQMYIKYSFEQVLFSIYLKFIRCEIKICQITICISGNYVVFTNRLHIGLFHVPM